MKRKNGGIIIKILFIIVIIVVGFLVFKALQPKTSYTKAQIIELINSKENKTNYEVEYTIPKELIGEDTKYHYKILNNKKKSELANGAHTYTDFESDKTVIVSEELKGAIIQNSANAEGNYYDDIMEYILNPKCKIKKEEKLFNRNTVVLSYDDKIVIGPGEFNIDREETVKCNIQMWIDTETGFLLQTVVKANTKKAKIVYNVKLNTVTEQDVIIPDLSGYEIIDTTKN